MGLGRVHHARDGVEEVPAWTPRTAATRTSYLLGRLGRGRRTAVGVEVLEMGGETARIWNDAAIEPLRVIRQRLKKPFRQLGDEARIAARR